VRRINAQGRGARGAPLTAPRWLRVWWLGRRIKALRRQFNDADLHSPERLALLTQIINLSAQRAVLQARR
jgi:hypothetical protein